MKDAFSLFDSNRDGLIAPSDLGVLIRSRPAAYRSRISGIFLPHLERNWRGPSSTSGSRRSRWGPMAPSNMRISYRRLLPSDQRTFIGNQFSLRSNVNGLIAFHRRDEEEEIEELQWRNRGEIKPLNDNLR